nr:LOW QUALITY PROTEIN: uncharacterized ABC transporter ATP-binding protein/permease YOL075C-like [Dermatophagoides farinae]
MSINSNNESQQQISIVWRNLSYHHHNPLILNDKKSSILQCLNGHLRYYTLNGLLGPSGSGKTTLLKCLSGLLKSGLSVHTELYLNASESKRLTTLRFIGQNMNDSIYTRMTIRQILSYAFRFKNDRSHLYDIDSHISIIMNDLLMDETILDRRFDQCSGGEQHRIIIAQELMSLTQPTFLFIDEPTTGLDSNAALLIMKCLWRLAHHNRMTIFVSIHTPNTDIMTLFDKIYILATGGLCIYSDSPEFLDEKIATDQAKISNQQPSSLLSPIERFIQIACDGIDNPIIQKWTKLTLEKENEQFNRIMMTDDDNNRLKFQHKGIVIQQKSFRFKDLYIQLRRMFSIVFMIEWQNLLSIMLFYMIVFPFIASFFDEKIVQYDGCMDDDNDELNESTINSNQTCMERLQNEINTNEYMIYLWYCQSISGYSIMMLSTISITSMFHVFRNEHQNQWYHFGVLFTSITSITFIQLGLLSSLIGIMIYFSVDHSYVDQHHQLNWYRLVHFICFIWLNNIYLQSFGHLWSIIFSGKSELAIIVGMFFFQSTFLFSGFMINLNRISAMKIFSNLFPVKIISNGLMYSFYGLNRCHKSSILDDFDVNIDHVYSDVYLIIVHCLLTRFITYMIMLMKFIGSNIFCWPKKFSPFTDIIHIINHHHHDNRNANDMTTEMIKINNSSKELKKIKKNQDNEKIIIAWRSIHLFASSSLYEIRSINNIDNHNMKKLILKNLNGQFRFGTLNAVMGPSGSGKTSLLKILNGQWKTRLSYESKFYLNRFQPIKGCYLQQDVSGHLMSGLTARQTLVYASRLKNLIQLKKIDHEAIADKILNELSIIQTANIAVQNCSNGERKRLALGMEMTSIMMPNLICIDEPTSGLDSNSTEIVIACLRRIAYDHNVAIVAAVHQPQTEIFTIFDEVYVLAKDGVCVYSGRPNAIVNHLSKVLNFDSKLNHHHHNQFSPIEQLINYCSLEMTDSIVQKMVNITDDHIIKNAEIQIPKQLQLIIDGIQRNRERFSLKSSWILLQRYIHNPLFKWTIIMSIFPIILIVLLRQFYPDRIARQNGCFNFIEEDFNNTICDDEPNGWKTMNKDLLDNTRFTIYMTFIFLTWILIPASILFTREMILFHNEHRNGWYSTGAFYLMKSMAEFLPMFITTIVFVVYIANIYESSIHFNGLYFWMILLFIFGSLAMQGMGHSLAIITNGNFFALITILPGWMTLLFLLSNFASPIQRLNYLYQFLSNLSPYRFVLEALLILQYGFERCQSNEIPIVLYQMMAINNPYDQHFYHCIRQLIFNIFFYRLLAIIMLIIRTEPFDDYHRKRCEKIHRQMLPQL